MKGLQSDSAANLERGLGLAQSVSEALDKCSTTRSSNMSAPDANAMSSACGITCSENGAPSSAAMTFWNGAADQPAEDDSRSSEGRSWYDDI